MPFKFFLLLESILLLTHSAYSNKIQNTSVACRPNCTTTTPEEMFHELYERLITDGGRNIQQTMTWLLPRICPMLSPINEVETLHRNELRNFSRKVDELCGKWLQNDQVAQQPQQVLLGEASQIVDELGGQKGILDIMNNLMQQVVAQLEEHETERETFHQLDKLLRNVADINETQQLSVSQLFAQCYQLWHDSFLRMTYPERPKSGLSIKMRSSSSDVIVTSSASRHRRRKRHNHFEEFCKFTVIFIVVFIVMRLGIFIALFTFVWWRWGPKPSKGA